MAATDSARKSTAVDDPAPRSNAPFGYTARNICTFSNIAYAPETMQTRLRRLSYAENRYDSRMTRTARQSVDYILPPSSNSPTPLKASLSNFRAFTSDCICWRVTRSAHNTFWL
ncbi:hypothetical protein FPRO05_12104 [Fusarium proliferatum]|uniref:Uncharacterized protein n=1 Tax=Gibberella intermedia TaxID=948311 RepID=A0A365N4Z2_GIBIN|nr:hypothetical protein FPRO05_12104 [Fusarium proliferatum]